MNGLRIGEFAKQSHVHVETVRYYERRGLIPKPPRTGSSYRVYSFENICRVKFIKQAQELGFSLKEIKKLLALRAAPHAKCADVRNYAARKIEDIEERVRALTRMRRSLEKLLRQCSGDLPATACPILESLESESQGISRQNRSKRRVYGHCKKSRNL